MVWIGEALWIGEASFLKDQVYIQKREFITSLSEKGHLNDPFAEIMSLIQQ